MKSAKVVQGEKGVHEFIKILNCHFSSIILQVVYPFSFQFNAMCVLWIHAFN